MRFRLIPKSVTLNDLERRNGPYFALFYRMPGTLIFFVAMEKEDSVECQTSRSSLLHAIV